MILNWRKLIMKTAILVFFVLICNEKNYLEASISKKQKLKAAIILPQDFSRERDLNICIGNEFRSINSNINPNFYFDK